jgi:hypothetical protein
MPDQHSAAILTFPTSTQTRLRRSLADLDTALAEQRTALAAWRAALADLRDVTGSIKGSLEAYDSTLGGLATQVRTLNLEAHRLEAWADSALEHAAG